MQEINDFCAESQILCWLKSVMINMGNYKLYLSIKPPINVSAGAGRSNPFSVNILI